MRKRILGLQRIVPLLAAAILALSAAGATAQPFQYRPEQWKIVRHYDTEGKQVGEEYWGCNWEYIVSGELTYNTDLEPTTGSCNDD
jgi:hypothetical protein